MREVILATCFRSNATSPGAVTTSGIGCRVTGSVRRRSRTAGGGCMERVLVALRLLSTSGGRFGGSAPRSPQPARSRIVAVMIPLVVVLLIILLLPSHI